MKRTVQNESTNKIIHNENQEVRLGKTEDGGSGWVGEWRRTPGPDEELINRCRWCGWAVEGSTVDVDDRTKELIK